MRKEVGWCRRLDKSERHILFFFVSFHETVGYNKLGIFPGCSNWSYQKYVRNPVLLILGPKTFDTCYQLWSALGRNRCSCGDKRRRQQLRSGRVAESLSQVVCRTGCTGWHDVSGQDWTACYMTLRRKKAKSRTRVHPVFSTLQRCIYIYILYVHTHIIYTYIRECEWICTITGTSLQ